MSLALGISFPLKHLSFYKQKLKSRETKQSFLRSHEAEETKICVQ